jgi:hypothetical protein
MQSINPFLSIPFNAMRLPSSFVAFKVSLNRKACEVCFMVGSQQITLNYKMKNTKKKKKKQKDNSWWLFH